MILGVTAANLSEMDVTEADLPDIGPEWYPLFAAGPGFQSSRAWFEATVEAALPLGTRATFLLCRDAGRPVVMLPLLLGPGRRAHGLSTVYTCLFQPLLAKDLGGCEIRRAGAALARHCRRWPLVLLDALDPLWPGLPPLLDGLRDGGLVARRFAHFANWHEPVACRSWEDYLAARPGPLRETIRRKSSTCARDGRIRFECITAPEALGPAVAAYEDVYRRSWKGPEAAPGFTAALLQRAAKAGVLRLGVMWAAEQPVAAQYWIVADKAATVLKLAHDDGWRQLSPGTVLTAYMVRRLLGEGVDELDFGRGDDAYKSSWTGERRMRIGVLLGNCSEPAGMLALARHSAGQLWQKMHTYFG